jgi:hypothetical protein
MSKASNFYKNEHIGTFTGNILLHIALLFPEHIADYLRVQESVYGEWELYERITWDGNHGYRYFTSVGMSARVLELMLKIYNTNHIDDGYPTIFDGSADNLPIFCLTDIDYTEYDINKRIVITREYFVLWLPNRINVPPKSQ